MILATRHAGDRQLRSFNSSWDAYTRRAPARGGVSSGTLVTVGSATGLPAVGRAIRLVAGQVASLPILVFEGKGGDKRARQNTPVAELLDMPALDMSDFDWRWDVASALEAHENALLLKVKSRGRVQELLPVPSEAWSGHVRADGVKVFTVHTSSGWAELTSADVLHIRGQTVGGGAFGVSRISQHADPIGSMQAAQTFEGAHFRNTARPDVAILFPQGVSREQAREWKDYWDSNYGGPENAGQAVPLGGGATIEAIPVSLRDLQWVENKNLTIEDVGRIMDVDSALLGAPEDGDVRKSALELFLRLQLTPRLKRIERALKADTDLFPVGSALYPEFEVPSLMYADPLTRAQVQHQQIQNGSLLVDEARADNGRPPLPDGMGQIPQVVPVGGAPNPTPLPPAEDDDTEDTNED